MYTTGRIHSHGLSLLRRMARHASELRNIPEQVLFKYYIKVLNFTLLKHLAKIVYLKATCNADAKSVRQSSNTTLRAVNRLVYTMSEQPHV